MLIIFKQGSFVLILLILLLGCYQDLPEIHPTLTVIPDLPKETIITSPSTLTIEALPRPTMSATRRFLPHEDLLHGFEVTTPLDEIAFVMPIDALPSTHVFEGRLELLGEQDHGNIEVIRGSFPPELAYLPAFDFAFVQYGTHFIPVQRTLIIGKDSGWNILLEPGRVWQETADQGYSRASFPFTLVPKGSNATFNGTMTFVFNDLQVSKVWYQITQETTTSASANFWGLLDAVYHQETITQVEQIGDDFIQEQTDRFPTKPIEELTMDFPGIELSAFNDRIPHQDVTWYGFIINGVNYRGGCQTRFGRYPYCDSMRAASYSTSKSAFTAVALMQLAQRFGSGVDDFLIRDYVPEYTDSRGDWQHVTFNHALDMATGNYQSGDYMVDDDGEQMAQYFQTQPYASRIAAAFDWPHRENPGQRWVYRTCDTFILTRAMHNLLLRKQGPDADIYRYVVDEVYKPLNIGPGAFSTLRTEDDNWQGQAEGGYGLWWVADDIAKITTLLNNANGEIEGVQVLQPDLLRASLQQNPRDRGLKIDRNRYYNNGFWATRYTKDDGFDCEFWTIEMLGISGNVVTMMPNGTTYYSFSDGHEFYWKSAVRESDKIIPMCASEK